MFYITGDTHIPIDIGKLNMKKWPDQQNLTRDDYLIICGDFGGVWADNGEDKYWQKWLNKKPFTTLFVDGNHENFNRLNAYPVEIWNGGKIHRIKDNIIHLMRGQVFTINNIKIFTMGGASSHDKECRTENVSWWKDELPSNDEYDEAITNLTNINWEVDLVITHCAPTTIHRYIKSYYEIDMLTQFLDIIIKNQLSYKHWYFGHYHTDKEIDEKHMVLYNTIINSKVE